MLDPRHPLFRLSNAIDWEYFEEEFGRYYTEKKGRPGKPIRLLVGLHYLKNAYDESDESCAERFLENPYWQYFCGFEHFQHEFPLEPTTLVRRRKRIDEEEDDKAEKNFRAVYQANPDNPNACFMLGMVLAMDEQSLIRIDCSV